MIRSSDAAMAGDKSDRFAVSEERVGRVLVAFMALGFAAIVAAAIAIGWISLSTRAFGERVFHTQEVRQEIGELQVTVERSETARRGFLLTRNPIFATRYAGDAATLPRRVAAVRGLVGDNPAQVARIDAIGDRLARLARVRTGSIALARSGRTVEARENFATDGSVDEIRALRADTGALAREEDRLLAIRSARQERSGTVFFIVLGGTGLLVALFAILAFLVVQRSTRRLAGSRDQLRTLNETLEGQVGERTADLSRANEEIQRFAYIVSHDLRSPLVNVMGFTAELETATGEIARLIDRAEAVAPEIVTEEARLAAREDLPEAIGFIRTSTQKMDRLINAILTLSRQGRRVLAPEKLDMTAMVEDIRGSLAHRLDELGAEVVVEGALPEVVADRVAVEQIMSNLIENAVKYAHPARPVRVAVRGGKIGARVWYEVQDNGRGIDPRDHERVFDLFRRSGAQDQPGEGIGLAHVRAVAYRLGGNVDLRSELGEGATFRLSLPQSMTVTQENRL